MDMNKVDALKNEINDLALAAGLGVKFTQTNGSGFNAVSRVYIYPIGEKAPNCNSSNVIKTWEFNQRQTAGTTPLCIRYRTYIGVLDFIKNHSASV
jgi:hypothetical protein